MSTLAPAELSGIIAGAVAIDAAAWEEHAAAWEEHAVVRGQSTSTQQVVTWFWGAVRGLSDSERARLCGS